MLDGRGAAQVGQKRGVHVQAAVFCGAEDARRDEQAEGDGDDEVVAKRGREAGEGVEDVGREGEGGCGGCDGDWEVLA